jgi:hypothetical protein
MLAAAMAGVRFRLSTGEDFFKSVEGDGDVPLEMESFRVQAGEYGADWFPVDNGVWVLRDAVISVTPVMGGEPLVDFG